MTKAEQLQRAIDWIIENKMEDKFCTVSLYFDQPRISFMRLSDMIEALHWQKAKVSSAIVNGCQEIEAEALGINFSCMTSECAKEPGTYTLDKSLLKAELVG
jgi:hypothetical protein